MCVFQVWRGVCVGGVQDPHMYGSTPLEWKHTWMCPSLSTAGHGLLTQHESAENMRLEFLSKGSTSYSTEGFWGRANSRRIIRYCGSGWSPLIGQKTQRIESNIIGSLVWEGIEVGDGIQSWARRVIPCTWRGSCHYTETVRSWKISWNLLVPT